MSGAEDYRNSPFSILERGIVGSTNDEASELARQGAPHFTAISAKAQNAGRGRRGREWSSPPGNLYLSMILRPNCPVAEAAQLSLVAALGLGDALGEYVDAGRIAQKWPNDVLVDNRKIAGLLLESSGGGGPRVEWVVIGCGVNIAFQPDIADYKTTSLDFAAGRETPVDEFLQIFLQQFNKRYQLWTLQGIGPIREAWLVRASGLGKEITVRLPHKELRGVFEDMDASGALVLRTNDGDRELITAGEIFAEG